MIPVVVGVWYQPAISRESNYVAVLKHFNKMAALIELQVHAIGRTLCVLKLGFCEISDRRITRSMYFGS
jgi:hypothetical protein